ncbi:MAG: dephospho-CoA kinase [Candidatus Gastranaerophilales bacterium]|nr:dephospho-CoA kinase [Candidatus Gastranaerophilales bacterium]
MLKIGITGNIASGKSSVEKILLQQGYSVMDTDKTSHKLMSHDNDTMMEITELFAGQDIYTSQGSLSREKIGKIVFNDSDKLEGLEAIIHPKIKKQMDNYFDSQSEKDFAFVSIPQLFETGFNTMFDYVVLIVADYNTRLQRLIARNSFSEDYARKRLESQISQEDKILASDFVIDNNGDLAKLEQQVNKLLQELKQILP